jgi:hypothetical protein
MRTSIPELAKPIAVNTPRATPVRKSSRLNYYRRIFSAYLTPRESHLTFWHEVPIINEAFRTGELGEYYMPFAAKANYAGHYDATGIPMLDYRGTIGLQYNPIAIAQYGLGNYNLYARGDAERRRKFFASSDWLVRNLEQNPAGLWVWNHHFDWEYRDTLVAPWYSGLAQGQGISLLVRAHAETRDSAYLDAAKRAFKPLLKTMDDGGVTYIDEAGDPWLEEYIVSPPTHILNGFIWATWGVYDYWLATGDVSARELFDRCTETVAKNLHRYDTGFWSLYEQSGMRLKMLASPFYHALHVTQLEVLYRMTGNGVFQAYARKWGEYRNSYWKRIVAVAYKSVFKLIHY